MPIGMTPPIDVIDYLKPEKRGQRIVISASIPSSTQSGHDRFLNEHRGLGQTLGRRRIEREERFPDDFVAFMTGNVMFDVFAEPDVDYAQLIRQALRRGDAKSRNARSFAGKNLPAP
jgi:hypothetical protein